MRSSLVWFSLGAIVMSGCAVFKSEHLEMTNVGEGLVYYLPMRYAKVTFERFQLNRAEVVARLTAATEAHAKLVAELEAAGQADDLATRELAALVGNEVPKTSPAYADAAKRLAAAEQAKALLPGQIKAAKAALEKASADAALAAGTDAWVDRFAVAVLPPVADPRYRFELTDEHSAARTETVVLKTTRSGLLTSVDSDATDQTKEIIVAIARAVGGFAVIASAARAEEPPPSCKRRDLALRVERSVDPTSLDDLAGFVDEVNRVGCEEDGVLYRVVPPTSAAGDERQRVIRACQVFERLKDTVTADKGAMAQAEQLCATLPVHQANLPAAVNGIYYRRELPVRFGIQDTNGVTIATFNVEVPNHSPPEWIAMEVGAFGHAKRNLAFDNGMLISLDSTRDSEFLQVATTPYDALRAALEAMSEVLQLKLNVATGETSLVNQRAELEKARLAVVEAQQALEQATTAQTAGE